MSQKRVKYFILKWYKSVWQMHTCSWSHSFFNLERYKCNPLEIIYESGFNAERFWKCDFDGEIIATYISMIWNLNSHKLAGQCVCECACVCEREWRDRWLSPRLRQARHKHTPRNLHSGSCLKESKESEWVCVCVCVFERERRYNLFLSVMFTLSVHLKNSWEKCL